MKGKILLLEDELRIAEAIAYGLEKEGLTVKILNTGQGALKAIEDFQPDVLLLDVMLPDVSGYEICQEVRADAGLSNVKILLMTARGSAMERRKGLALGADGFISKPFELKELRGEVHRLLEAGGA